MRFITLTTDFGSKDWFVGTMKGVILGIAPRATVVDITHEVPPGDIRAGAFALLAAFRYFPTRTVHVVVVDPGVGSARQAIAVQTVNYFFVGPDNGVLSWALARENVKSIRRLENEKCFRHPVSRTFHGRDVFAPVAAHLSKGFTFAKLGRELKNPVPLPWPRPRKTGDALHGEIVYIDHFGNAITNIDIRSLKSGKTRAVRVFAGRKVVCGLADFYQAVPPGKPVAVFGSSGFLEIAVNGASAAQHFKLRVGDGVTVRPH